jgi:pilus assembly protein Flp/PilA
VVEYIVAQAMNLRDVLADVLRRDEEGQDMIEYALLAALISIVAIVMILAIGPYIQNTFQDVANALQSA